MRESGERGGGGACNHRPGDIPRREERAGSAVFVRKCMRQVEGRKEEGRRVGVDLAARRNF